MCYNGCKLRYRARLRREWMVMESVKRSQIPGTVHGLYAYMDRPVHLPAGNLQNLHWPVMARSVIQAVCSCNNQCIASMLTSRKSNFPGCLYSYSIRPCSCCMPLVHELLACTMQAHHSIPTVLAEMTARPVYICVDRSSQVNRLFEMIDRICVFKEKKFNVLAALTLTKR